MFGILILIVVIIIFILYYKVNSDYWRKRNIHQVDGTLWRFVVGKKSLPEIYKDIYDTHSNLPYVGTLLGTNKVLILRDIENFQAVLHNDFQSFYKRGFAFHTTDFLTDNTLFLDDFVRWKLIKQKISPVFTKANTKNLFNITERCARDFMEYIKENPDITKNPLNAVFIYTTASTSCSLFGISEETRNMMNTSLTKLAYESITSTSQFNLKFALTTVSANILKFLNFKAFGAFEDLFIQLLNDMMEKRRNDGINHNDFIDLCLKLIEEGVIKDPVTGYKINVTVELLAAQAFSFIIGGVDTSAYALHYTLLELSNNPKILQKVHNEIDEIFKNNGGSLTFEDIENLEYTEKVINEALRKYPPIAFIQRRCCKDTVFPIGGVKIEKGTFVIIPAYAIHMDAKYFPNPDVFDPERYSKENAPKITKYTYMPFGEGKRMCIGLRLARMEMKTGLAWLLREFTLKEQSYKTKYFEQSVVNLRDPNAHYELISRKLNNCN